jgi:hypothetical protein
MQQQRASRSITLIISATATDLLIACPMAFNTISLILLSWLYNNKKGNKSLEINNELKENYILVV